MKINTLYNCIVLLYLQAFCLLLCFQIEDIYSVNLNMATSVLNSTNAYWSLWIRMLYLSPFSIYYFFKKKEDTESTHFDKVFGIILAIILLLVVITQSISCGNNILSFDIPLTPGLLCIGVNVLALGLYYLWIYSQQKFSTSEKTNLIRICNISFVLISICYGLIVTNIYTPFKTMRLLNKDNKLCHVVSIAKYMDKVYDSTDDMINHISEARYQEYAKKFVDDKHLSYEKINENKYKISWKPYLPNPARYTVDRSLISGVRYISNNFYSDKHEAIIEVKPEKSKEKIKRETIVDNNNKQNNNKHTIILSKEQYNALTEQQKKELCEVVNVELAQPNNNNEPKDNNKN